MPEPQAKIAEQMARAEKRTMSELVREALRRYEKERRREIIEEAGKRAKVLGIEEEDGPRIVKEWRREQREKKDRPKA